MSNTIELVTPGSEKSAVDGLEHIGVQTEIKKVKGNRKIRLKSTPELERSRQRADALQKLPRVLESEKGKPRSAKKLLGFIRLWFKK